MAQDIVLQRLNVGRAGIEAMLSFYLVVYHLGITPLEDVAMDMIGNGYYKSKLIPTNGDIELAYEKTGPESALRCYMARQFQQKILTSTAGPSKEELNDLLSRHPALAIHFVVQSRGVLTNGLWRTEVLPTCEFHEHGDEDPCPNGQLGFKWVDYGAVGFNVADMQQRDTIMK
jgi:hypothetical protein